MRLLNKAASLLYIFITFSIFLTPALIPIPFLTLKYYYPGMITIPEFFLYLNVNLITVFKF